MKRKAMPRYRRIPLYKLYIALISFDRVQWKGSPIIGGPCSDDHRPPILMVLSGYISCCHIPCASYCQSTADNAVFGAVHDGFPS